MRIAHIVSTYPPYYGGMGNVVFQTAQALDALGHEVVVFTPGYYGQEEIGLAQEKPTLTHTVEVQEQIDYAKKLKPSFQYGNAARLPQLGRELKDFDIVHLHYPFFGTAGMISDWKKKNPLIPLVITYHMDTRSPGWKGLIFKYYAKYWMPKILRSADVLLASSLDYVQASDASAIYEENKDKWLELPFGVDIERFNIRQKPDALFVKYNLNPELPTIIFVGGMDHAHYFKGVAVLIKAIGALKAQGEVFQAILVGEGDLRADFENRALFYGLEDRVKFAGRVEEEELSYYYNIADLCVLPSINRGEAFGMVLLEAMASGVPVVASDLPGVRSVAKDGGIVVEPNNHQALAQAIAGYFSSDTNGEEWGMQVRQVAEEKYSWEVVIKQLEGVYQELVG